MAQSVMRKLWLLIWKNLILRKRQYIVTAMEIILPTLFAILMAYIRANVNAGSNGEKERFFESTPEERILDDFNGAINLCYGFYNNTPPILGYVPNTEVVNKFVWEELGPELLNNSGEYCENRRIDWTGFNNERELEAFVANQQFEYDYTKPTLNFAFVIDGLLPEGQEYPENHKISYKIRLVDRFYDTTDLMPWLIEASLDCGYIGIGNYFYSGFSGFQIMMDKLLTKKLSNVEADYKINTGIFPCPAHDGFDINQLYFIFLPQFMIIGFIFIVPSVVRGIVSEKETGIKELMKMTGLPNSMHWIGWMINSLVILIISISIVVLILFIPFRSENGAVLVNSDPSVWWVSLFIYCIWATSYCFLISSLFERPTLATTVGIVVWLGSYYGVSIPLEQKYNTLSLSSKLLLCLSPNMGLHYLLKILSGFEAKKDIGAQWKNIGKTVSSLDSLTLAHVLLMLIVATIIYTMLAMYIECILPTKYGVRKPPYFIFMPSTWGIGRKKSSLEDISYLRSQVNENNQDSFEKITTDMAVGMEILKLRKEFGNKKVAVDDISVKAYHGHIFCLLGHNGAGKTTTMSVILGLLGPTSGTALINGKDIRFDMDEIRQNCSLAPQHNLLFDKLTVAEHLKFFGMVKGLSSDEAISEIPALIKKVKLEEKADALAMSLSGGQKRRLSLLCAVIGNSKILFLDEPSSGLDPENRRLMWDLLLEIRGERTIILTTHFLEEADVLGDRIAIMSQGKIQCCGSPTFLKRYYGTGYTLSISMTENGQPEYVLGLVRKHIPQAFIKSQIRNAENIVQVSITLSNESNSTSQFPALFSSIQSQKTALEILDISISLTTMDEVFLKVDELSHSVSNGHVANNNDSLTVSSNQRNEGLSLLIQQFWGLLLKKILYCLRRWKLTLSQTAIPVLLLIAAVLIINTSYGTNDNTPPLTMTLSSYKMNHKVLYTTDDSDRESQLIGQSYSNIVGSYGKKVANNLTEELLNLARTEEAIYFQQHLVAAELNDPLTILAMFSSIPPHSCPLSINLATNAMLQYYDKQDKKYSIEVTNHPLSSGRQEIFDAASPEPSFAELSPFVFGILVSIGLALLAASYIILPIEERRCQSKQLQLMTGVDPFVYWGSALLWDYFILLICAAVMVACLYIFEVYQGFTNNGGGGVMFVIMAVYGIGAISFSYMLSLVAETPAGGFSLVTIIHIISGSGFALGVYILQDDISLESSAKIIGWIGRLFPTYGISKSLMTYSRLATQNSRCNAVSTEIKDIICKPGLDEWISRYQSCCDNCEDLGAECFKPKPYFVWSFTDSDDSYYAEFARVVPGISQEIVFMAIMSCIYFTLLMLVEYGWVKRLLNKVWKVESINFSTHANDTDVQAEVDRVNSMVQRNSTSEDALVVSDLCKSYGAFSAVSKLSFGVHHGECFGLLGVNGAGKTTCFKMLTGEEIISNGNAWIQNKCLQTDRKSFLQNIGYCPQFDGIVGVLTGREMLDIFGRLRGIKNSELTSISERWLDRFGLLESGNVHCQKYSGGMKRRLSAAMALIGDPPIIFMDEPTSGVDPASRRQFWNIITSLRDSGRSIILTSHSMEECEHLCSRLGIMVNGEFQCIGRAPHLKNKFAQGYSLMIRLKSGVPETQTQDFINALVYQVTTRFNPCSLKDHHMNVLQFHIESIEMQLDKVFETMEGIKVQFESYIEEYSIQQTTLEEVFLSFARQQYIEVREVQASKFRKAISCIFAC